MQGAGGGWERAGQDASRPGRTVRTPAPVVQGNGSKGMDHGLKLGCSRPWHSLAHVQSVPVPSVPPIHLLSQIPSQMPSQMPLAWRWRTADEYP